MTTPLPTSPSDGLVTIHQERQREAEILQAILDNTQTGIAVMQSVRDADGRVIDFRFSHVNPEAGRITQREPENLVGELYSVAWPEARTNGVLDWHIRVAETGEPLRLNGVNIPAGSYNGWYNVRIRPLNDGVIATFVDVTALKQAELANQRQAELLRSLLDNSSNAIIAFQAVRDDPMGQITDFRYVAHNEANRRNMGLSDDEIIGYTLLTFFPPMRDNGLFDRFRQVAESGKAVQFEQEFRVGGWDGWFEISATKWGDGIVLTLVDITSSKARQQELERANRDLTSANDNLRQFAYIASHDLQEPLRKIMAFGDILHGQYAEQLGDAGRDIIDRMKSATTRMSVLIRDVLAYSRISTHREPFRPVPLADILNNLTHELRDELQAVDARVSIDALPVVPGDRSQLGQLFWNLLVNALKFKAAGRPLQIHISCQRIVGAAGHRLLEPVRAYHEISITDNGIGFDNTYADRIFQVFQRLHTRQEYDGTGIGLAICKRIAENHHGAIVATGHSGEGATFRVYLPVG